LEVWRIPLVFVICATMSCSSEKQGFRAVSVEDLLASQAQFAGEDLAVHGCLKANPHGLLLKKCDLSGHGVSVVFSEDAQGKLETFLLGSAMRSEIEAGHPLVGTVCGRYSQTGDGEDRWIDVDSFSINGRSYGESSYCGAAGAR